MQVSNALSVSVSPICASALLCLDDAGPWSQPPPLAFTIKRIIFLFGLILYSGSFYYQFIQRGKLSKLKIVHTTNEKNSKILISKADPFLILIGLFGEPLPKAPFHSSHMKIKSHVHSGKSTSTKQNTVQVASSRAQQLAHLITSSVTTTQLCRCTKTNGWD